MSAVFSSIFTSKKDLEVDHGGSDHIYIYIYIHIRSHFVSSISDRSVVLIVITQDNRVIHTLYIYI